MDLPNPLVKPPPPGSILLHAAGDCAQSGVPRGWLWFERPVDILECHQAHMLPPLLDKVREALAQGHWVAGFISYEAAPAFDTALRVHDPGDTTPLVWFGVYEGADYLDAPPWAGGGTTLEPLAWQPGLEAARYAVCHEQARELIAAGDTYQINLTYPLTAPLPAGVATHELFIRLHAAQQGLYSAYVQGTDWAIASASPELFFAQCGRRVVTRPMKGTAPRGRWMEEDARLREQLAASAKDRAENVMIVDLLRNDLGRIAQPGSVRVDRLFEVEPYPTVFQMTSTIEAETSADPVDALEALFPCGSVTGAPKVRTMEIIRGLETSPRGVYCGAIGFIKPGRVAQFNVAIRTLVCDLARRELVYGVGGGVTWGSALDQEYAESRVKARVLKALETPTTGEGEFELFETILWEPGAGWFLLEEHLARLRASAQFFGFDPIGIERGAEVLAAAPPGVATAQRVKLRINRTGEYSIEMSPLTGPIGVENPDDPMGKSLRVALHLEPVDPADCFLFHKTTRREVYDAALAAHPGTDDVLLINARGELTESSRANLVVKLGEHYLTPARECGLLGGAYRGVLLQSGRVREAILRPSDLQDAEGIWLINSVRRWLPMNLHGAQ